jgi:hypothetical protein
MDQRISECLGEVRDDRPKTFAPVRQRQCEFVRQWRGKAAHTVRKLHEVSRGKDPIFEQIKQKRIHIRPNGFHRVERKRIAIPLICVENAKGRIESGAQECEARLRFEQRVRIVEQCVHWIGRRARRIR